MGGLLASGDRIGLPVAVLCVAAVLGFVASLAGPLERWRLRLLEPDARPAARPLRDTGYGSLSVLAAGWADLALVLVALGIPAVLLTAPLQPTGPAWAGVRAAVTRAVLLPRDGELTEVRRSRARIVDAYEAERRRIERDLHDGAQQRLVALTMKLGLAGLDLPPQSRAAREVAEAHALAKEALTELRELIRGVHPQVLTERGLPAAVRDAAGRSPVPADVAFDLPGRLPGSVEVAAYFAVTEALANAARHSGAERCRVTGQVTDGVLVVEVADDGKGGADPAGGSGLTGLADRVAAVDGRMLLSSPVGGPTLVRVEIPCAG